MAKGSKGVNVGTLEAFLGLDDTDFMNGIRRAQSTLRSVGQDMRAVGRKMTTYISLPLMAIGGGAIKLAMDFETVFGKIQALTGTSREALEGMRSEIMALARETGKAPEELAEGLYFILSSGFAAADAMDVLEKSAKGAAIGLGSTQVVADGLTSIMNAYGHETMSAAKATNILIGTVNYGKAEADALANNIGYVVPIAAQMGIEFEEVGAAIASMTLTGADASTAITNLRQILSDFLSPTNAARGAMEGWGKSATEFRRIIREDGLLTALGFLREEMKKDEEAFSKIFGNVRSLTGALSLMGTRAEENGVILENLRAHYNFLDNGMKVVSQTARHQFNQALVELKIAGIELGNALLPLFIDLVKWVKQAANWFSSLDNTGKRLVITIGALATIAGPLLMVLGSMATVFAAISLEVVAVVAAVAALASGFIYLYENWEAVKERFTDTGWWRNMLIDMIKFLNEYNPIALLASGMLSLWNTLMMNLTKIWNKMAQRFQKFIKVDLTIAEDTMVLANPFEVVSEGMDQLKAETREYKHEFKSFGDSMLDFAVKAKNALLNIFPKGGARGNVVTEALPGQKPGLGVQHAAFTPTLKPLLGDIDESLLGMLKHARMESQLLADTFMELLPNAVSTFASAIGDAFASIGQSTQSFVKILAQATEQIISMFLQQSIAAMIAAHMKDPKTSVFPFAKVALAAAGIIAVKALFGQIQGLASGGYVSQGGVFQLHKDEMVSLPRGSAVTPAHLAQRGGMGGGSLTTEISLRRLIIELDNERARMGR